MAGSPVQEWEWSSATQVGNPTMPSRTCTAGNSIILSVQCRSTDTPVISGFSKIEGASAYSAGLQLYYQSGIAGGTTVISGSGAEFTGLHAVEVSGIGALISGAVNGQSQNGPGTGANALTSGSISVTSAPAWLYGLCFNSTASGNADPAPSAGTGFTGLASIWANIGGSAQAVATPEYARVLATGSAAATFTTTKGSDLFITVAAAFAETGTLLAGTAADTTGGAGTLTVMNNFGAGATDTTAGAAAFTTWATVTLTSPLYTGIGGILDPNLTWPYTAPGVGSVVYYDPTYLTILPDGETVWTTNNAGALVQFFDGTNWNLVILTVTPGMVGYPADTTTATGSLMAPITLAAAAQTLTSATGAIITASRFVGAALDTTSDSGTLGVQTQFFAGAGDATSAAGSLAVTIQLASAAADLTGATAALMTSINLLGNSGDSSAGVANLTTGINLVGPPPTDVTSGAGALNVNINLVSAAADVVTATAALVTSINLASSVLDLTSGLASLTTGAALVSAAGDTTNAVSPLTTQAVFVGSGADQSSAVAFLTAFIPLISMANDVTAAAGGFITNIALAAAVQSVSVATGSLGQVTLGPDPTFVISRPYTRLFTVSQTGKLRFDSMEPGESVGLTFDFSPDLARGELLTSVVSVVITTNMGTDPNPMALMTGTAGVDVTQTEVIVPVTAVNVNTDYLIVVKVKTTNVFKTPVLVGVLPVRL